MAEGVANVEIEDIVSSIRRLVSDENQPQRSESAPETSGKLVLTPSLRVLPDPEDVGLEEESEDVAPEEVSDAAASLALESDPDPEPTLNALEATIAELEAAVGEHGMEWEPDGSENEPVLDPPPAMFRSLYRGAARDEPEIENKEAEINDSLHALDDTVAAEFRPSDEPPEVADATATDADTVEQSIETSVMPEGAQELDDPATAPATDTDAEGRGKPELAPLELGEPATHADLQSAAVAEEDEEDEVLLDEDILRDMIASIVREELQGSFGAEITTNLRRMIRTEIHRYFDVRDDE